jgi:GNAT superfamily N-acetyltransferase
MAAAVQIRSATPADAATLLRLISALAEYEKLAHEVVATEDAILRTFFGDRPQAEAVIAYAGDAPVGLAIWFHNYSTFLARRGLYLEDLFVLPEWRGQGIGKALLVHLAGIAVQRQCGRMEWSVLDWNTPAIGFYRSLGAVPMDEWTVFRVTGDALKRLAEQNA